MPGVTHRFDLGRFRCVVIRDDEWQLSGPMTFANATPEEVAREAAAYTAATGDPAGYVSMNILLVDTGEQRVLVDTGNGPGEEEGSGQLMAGLAEAGVPPEEIDVVLITHGHGDHIQGNALPDGAPAFSNARYVISAPEWEHWTREPGESAQRHLVGLAERFERVALDAEVVPGVRLIPATGHTPGQVAVLVDGGEGQRLLHVADAFHHPVELPRPEWVFAFDHDQEQTVRTRRELLDLAAREGLLVLPYHFAFPGLGRVVAQGEAWTWRREG